MLAGFLAANHIGIAFEARISLQAHISPGIQMDRFWPCFGVGKQQQPVLLVDVLPSEGKDFTETRASERKQTDGSDRPRRCAFIPLRRAQASPRRANSASLKNRSRCISGYFSTCLQGLEPSGRNPCFSAQLKNFESSASVRLAWYGLLASSWCSFAMSWRLISLIRRRPRRGTM